MGVVISLLRGVNVGPHHRIRMDALRELYASLGLRDPRTYLQSGNVIFRTEQRDLAALAVRIEKKIEGAAGFRPAVILRTTSELRDAIAKNPFAARPGIDPARLLVTFLAGDPGAEALEGILAVNAGPEELRIEGRELYIYFPEGIGQSKLTAALIDKTLQTPGTGRNWNTVRNLLALAEKLEALP
jgi:uncharacterized protein (DUF1697 family)